MAIEKVEHKIVQTDNPLEILNNRNCTFTYAYICSDTGVIYICLRASTFW